jgi:hypothetical protein
LKVFLCTANGTQITQIPITAPLHNVDPFRDFSQQPRGAKLILAVSDGGSQPVWRDYQFAVGIMEDVEVVTLAPRDLPEDPLGYEAVDSIVWLDSDPAALDSGGQHKLAALQDYVRYGGQLVISQPMADWQKTANFGDLLPVVVSDIGTKNDLEPLRSMARPKERDPVPQPSTPGICPRVRSNSHAQQPSPTRSWNNGSTGKVTAHIPTQRHTWFAAPTAWGKLPGWLRIWAIP